MALFKENQIAKEQASRDPRYGSGSSSSSYVATPTVRAVGSSYSNGGFIYLKGNCPVCSGNSKKGGCYQAGNTVGCRVSTDNPIDSRYKPSLDGYTHRQDNLGVFYLYRPVREKKEYSDLEREKFAFELKLQRELAAQKDKEEISPLSLPERHLEGQKMLSSLTLGGEDRKRLRDDRGLPNEIIDNRLFKSYRGSESVSNAVSDKLPGITKRNGITVTNTYGEGFLVPVWNDFEAQIRGFQLRDNDPNTKNKYIWLRDKKHSPHILIEDSKELPIAVIIPSRIEEYSLNFCEGTLKPVVAAEKHKRIFIGASSGKYSPSPKQTQQAISKYEEWLKDNVENTAPYYVDGKLKAYIWVDAGDIINESVLQRLRTEIKFLESLNLSISIVFWGQITKDANDCDEITDENVRSIQLITPSKFFGFSESFVRRKYTPTPGQDYNEKHLPYIDFKDGHIYGVKSGLGTGKTTALIKYIDNHFEDIVKNYTQVILLGIRNTLLKQTIHKTNNAIDRELGKYFIHINDKDNIDIEKDRLLALCIDSLMKIDLDKIDDLILILDELVSFWGHIYFSTTHVQKQRNEIIEKFWALVNKAKLVICLDANLTDWALEPFLKLANKPVIKIDNRFKIETKNPYMFLDGVEFSETEKLRKDDKRPMIRDIRNVAVELKEINDQIKEAKKDKNFELVKELKAKRRPIVIPCDSQKFGEILEKMLIKEGLKGKRLDSKTSGLKISERFLEVPDSWIEENQPDYIIYSPSAESGLDISIKDYFKYRFCFFFGATGINLVDTAMQMIKRVRDDIQTKIWVKNSAISLSVNCKYQTGYKQLLKQVDDRFSAKLQSVLMGENMSQEIKIKVLEEYKEAKDFHYHFSMRMLAQSQSEKLYYRDSLFEMMKSLGYPVKRYTEIDPYLTDVDRLYGEARDERNLEDATEVFNAPNPILIDGKYQTHLNESNTGYWAGKVKAQYYNRLPGIADSPVWGIEFINLVRNLQPQLVKQMELEVKLRNLGMSQQAGSVVFKLLSLGKFRELWNLKDELGLLAVLDAVGLLDLVDSGESFLITEELVQRIIKACQTWSHRLFLGSQGKMSDVNWLRRLLLLVGYKLSSERVQKDGVRQQVYKIVPIIDNPQALATIKECVLYRLGGQAKKAAELSWEVEPILSSNEVLPPILKNPEVFFEKVPETVTEHGLDTCHLRLNSLTDFPPAVAAIESDSYQPEKVESVPQIEAIVEPIEVDEPTSAPTIVTVVEPTVSVIKNEVISRALTPMEKLRALTTAAPIVIKDEVTSPIAAVPLPPIKPAALPKPPQKVEVKIEGRKFTTGDKINYRLGERIESGIIWFIDKVLDYVSVQLETGTIYCAPYVESQLLEGVIYRS